MQLKVIIVLAFTLVCVNAKKGDTDQQACSAKKVTATADTGSSNTCETTGSVLAAQAGTGILEAATKDIVTQGKDDNVATQLTTCNDAFVQVAKTVATEAKVTAKVDDSGETDKVQIAAKSLSAQTTDVDNSLATIVDKNSTPAQIKAAAAQALADELAEGDERATLAAASKDQAGAKQLLAQVDQLGPSVVLNGFSQIAEGKGDTKKLAKAIVDAREQVIVLANCQLIRDGSGVDLCAGRIPIDDSVLA